MSTEIAVVAIPTLGICATALVGWVTGRSERQLRADVDAHERVVSLMALAHGRIERSTPVGSAEQVGALYLLESLALKQKRLRPAVIEFVKTMVDTFPESETRSAAEKVRDQLMRG